MSPQFKLDLKELLNSGMTLQTWFDKEVGHIMNSFTTPDGEVYNCSVIGPYNSVLLNDTPLTERFIKDYKLTIMG